MALQNPFVEKWKVKIYLLNHIRYILKHEKELLLVLVIK